jgi:ATPase subunit of ABC transporter with duplicated ATPase domains
MRKYTVLAVLTIQSGATLGLTGEQAARRSHLLKPLQVDKKTGDGTYQVLQPVQFKRGEVLSADADLNKQLAETLEPAEATEQRARQEAQKKMVAQDMAALKSKAKAWDDVQSELAALRHTAAAIQTLPQPLRDEIQKAEQDLATKAKK